MRLERASRGKIEIERMRLEGKKLERDTDDKELFRDVLRIMADAMATK